MLDGKAECVNIMATAAGLADVKTLLLRVYDRVDAHANSQAATNMRTESALRFELKAQTSIVIASGATAVPRAAESRMGSVQASRKAKRSKCGGGAAVEQAPDITGGSALVAATTAGASLAANVSKHPLVSDWSLPPKMMSQRFSTEPLAQKLDHLVKICHVSAGNTGIFGSFACAEMFEKGLVLLKDVASIRGAAEAVNATKT